MPHGIVNWVDLVEGFILTFIFEDDFPCIDSNIQIVIENIFGNATSLTWLQLDCIMELEHAL